MQRKCSMTHCSRCLINLLRITWQGNFNAKLGTEFFKPAVATGSLCKTSNDNGAEIVTCTLLEILLLEHSVTTLKYSWTQWGHAWCEDSQLYIYQILTDSRRHPRVLYVRHFRLANCDTGIWLVIDRIRERQEVKTKQHASLIWRNFSSN